MSDADRDGYQTVIIGAGIAGVASAHALACSFGHADVLVLDRQQPLSLTTAKSGENYRDYWPHPAMRSLSTTSINLLGQLIDQHGDVFGMRQTGYLFASRRAGHDIFASTEGPTTGLSADQHDPERVLDVAQIRRRWPHLDNAVEQVVLIKRAGAFDVQALGALLMSTARQAGVTFRTGSVQEIDSLATGFRVRTDRSEVVADHVILAAGPFTDQLATTVGVDLPLTHVAQRKFVIPDPARVVPTDMPFTINADPVNLDLTDSERAAAVDDPDLGYLSETMPPGLHIKPEPGGLIKLGWAFNRAADREPAWSIAEDPLFPSVVIRAAASLIPGLSVYVDRLPTPVIQYGGYYSRTAENWPLIGPTSQPGMFVVGGLAGFGTMTACAAGDLVARHVVGAELPGHARHMSPQRYRDADIVAELASPSSDGQL